MRKTPLQTDEYYHIYNRGVDKRNIFIDNKDYIRFLISLNEFNQPEPIDSLYRLAQIKKQETVASKALRLNRSALDATLLANVVCYCLLPNHYHLILKQFTKNGISKLMQKLGQGYTMYFNNKYNRSGSLFQGTFKTSNIKSDAQLLQLSCYIHGNPQIHKIGRADNWPWSSYLDFLGKRAGRLNDKKSILSQFENINGYKNLANLLFKDFTEQKSELKMALLEQI